MKNNQIKELDISSTGFVLATKLFKEGSLSLGRSANLANMTLAEFITHISRLEISAISQTDAEVEEDMDTLEEFLKT